jgi:hypothetical protein
LTSSAGLSDRIEPIAALRAKALLRHRFGDLEKAKAVRDRRARCPPIGPSGRLAVDALLKDLRHAFG